MFHDVYIVYSVHSAVYKHIVQYIVPYIVSNT